MYAVILLLSLGSYDSIGPLPVIPEQTPVVIEVPEEGVLPEEEIVSEDEEIVSEEEVVQEEGEIVSEDEEIVPEEEVVQEEEEIVSEEDVVQEEEEIVSEDALPLDTTESGTPSPEEADKLRQFILDNPDWTITILREAGLLPEEDKPALDAVVSSEPAEGEAIVEDPVYVYLYTMPGCPPCEQMLSDIQSYAVGCPFTLVTPAYPEPDRLGRIIQQYPLTQIVKGGRVTRTFVGYTPYEMLLEGI